MNETAGDPDHSSESRPQVCAEATGSRSRRIRFLVVALGLFGATIVASLLWVGAVDHTAGSCVSGITVYRRGEVLYLASNMLLVLVGISWAGFVRTVLGQSRSVLVSVGFRILFYVVLGFSALIIACSFGPPGPPPGMSYQACLAGWEGWDYLGR